MIFTEPTAFPAAVERLSELEAMPTDLGSGDLRKLDAAVRLRSLFSARTNSAAYVQELRDVLQQLADGRINMATARAMLQDKLDALGYRPMGPETAPEEHGFPGEENVHIPPAEPGSLQDLSSNERLRLVLETNVRQVANFGYRQEGNTPTALWQFPAWELIRLYPREIPRGMRRGRGGAIVPEPENAWPARWQRAGGTLSAGDRMVALKGDPIWDALGDSGLFEDGLDTPYPPFAFNSGMGWRQVPREECAALGVVPPAAPVDPPPPVALNEGLKSEAKIDADFLRSLKADLQGEIRQLRGGGVQLANRAAAVDPLRARAEELLTFLEDLR